MKIKIIESINNFILKIDNIKEAYRLADFIEKSEGNFEPVEIRFHRHQNTAKIIVAGQGEKTELENIANQFILNANEN